MGRYIKKPVIVEALKYTGNRHELEVWLISEEVRATGTEARPATIMSADDQHFTMEGSRAEITVLNGDYITVTQEGYLIPCAAALFEVAFEEFPSD